MRMTLPSIYINLCCSLRVLLEICGKEVHGMSDILTPSSLTNGVH